MMSISQSFATPPVDEPGALTRWLMPVFAGTLCLSAFLLFSIQPFFTKMLLPRLGGSPSVWSVAMVFFQAVLLAGYAYAHALSKLSSMTASVVHALVLLAAFLALPIAIPAGWENPPQTGQAFWLLGLFTVAVGLPFFAVSANGALLQAWFARSRHRQSQDPYFLYGASNIGSFASLILYIIAIEPMLTIPQQSIAWTVAYGALVASILACAALLARDGERPRVAASVATVALSPKQVAGWVWLGFIPSGLLVATTAHIATDVASAPFLWVLPLALFLLTFVLAFRAVPIIPITVLARATPLLAAVALITNFINFGLPVWAPIVIHVGFFFMAALYCNAVLYAKRPEVSRLTAFYLAMSFGGVLGGVFASLLAPVTFEWVAEYPILIVAVLLVQPSSRHFDAKVMQWVFLGVILAYVGGVLLRASTPADLLHFKAARVLVVIVLFLAMVQFRWRSLYLICVGSLLPLAFLFQDATPHLFRERSFFGVVQVGEADNGQFHRLSHGTTVHGAERFLDSKGQAIEGIPEPLTYYHGKGGIAATIKAAQGSLAKPGRFGAVGLGAGSVACYARPHETWTFFEIDQTVVNAARDPKLFRFLDRCGSEMPIVLGDARLTLSNEPDGGFDYLLVDAFSSDAIPTHLMTKEALALFRSKISPEGLLVFHISNRYLELETVMAAIARDLNVPIRIGTFPVDPNVAFSSASVVAAMTTNPELLARLDADPLWKIPQAGTTTAWTDDYSNIFAALLRQGLK